MGQGRTLMGLLVLAACFAGCGPERASVNAGTPAPGTMVTTVQPSARWGAVAAELAELLNRHTSGAELGLARALLADRGFPSMWLAAEDFRNIYFEPPPSGVLAAGLTARLLDDGSIEVCTGTGPDCRMITLFGETPRLALDGAEQVDSSAENRGFDILHLGCTSDGEIILAGSVIPQDAARAATFDGQPVQVSRRGTRLLFYARIQSDVPNGTHQLTLTSDIGVDDVHDVEVSCGS